MNHVVELSKAHLNGQLMILRTMRLVNSSFTNRVQAVLAQKMGQGINRETSSQSKWVYVLTCRVYFNDICLLASDH